MNLNNIFILSFHNKSLKWSSNEHVQNVYSHKICLFKWKTNISLTNIACENHLKDVCP